MRILLAAALLTSAAPIAAQTSDQSSAVPAPVLTTPDAKDVWTYAQPEIARVTHVGLDLDVDFDSRTLSGHATLDIQAQPDAGEIILDSDNLKSRALPM